MLHDNEESISKTAEPYEIKEKMTNQVTRVEILIISV